MLNPHFIGDAGFRQAHELSERRMRSARAARLRRDQARDRGVAVSIERAQVNVRGSCGRPSNRPIGRRRSSARTARAFAGLGARSKRLSSVPRPRAPERPAASMAAVSASALAFRSASILRRLKPMAGSSPNERAYQCSPAFRTKLGNRLGQRDKVENYVGGASEPRAVLDLEILRRDQT